MAKYAVPLTRTASTTLSVGAVTAAASSPRRFKISDVLIAAAEATPADNGLLWQLQRCTTAGTAGSAVTPQALDPADAAATTVAGQAHSADPTLTSNAILFTQGLNQRAAYRWVAQPGYELVAPATASNGMALRTPTATAVTCSATLYIEEQ